jgi:hypothetical protein
VKQSALKGRWPESHAQQGIPALKAGMFHASGKLFPARRVLGGDFFGH